MRCSRRNPERLRAAWQIYAMAAIPNDPMILLRWFFALIAIGLIAACGVSVALAPERTAGLFEIAGLALVLAMVVGHQQPGHVVFGILAIWVIVTADPGDVGGRIFKVFEERGSRNSIVALLRVVRPRDRVITYLAGVITRERMERTLKALATDERETWKEYYNTYGARDTHQNAVALISAMGMAEAKNGSDPDAQATQLGRDVWRVYVEDYGDVNLWRE